MQIWKRIHLQLLYNIIMVYTISFFDGFIEALKDFVNTQKNK